jgi:hypothetical protein
MLKGSAVFLSASFPSPGSPTYYHSADPDEMTQAIVALARAVLAVQAGLVFGGHPTVSPLVMMVAEEYLPSSLEERRQMVREGTSPVVIYQSRAFRGSISPATRRMQRLGLGKTVWAPPFGPEKSLVGETNDPRQFPRSLRMLRRRMLTRHELVAAVFIGGMEGIKEEESMFKDLQPSKPCYAVGAPGGAARDLASTELSRIENVDDPNKDWARDLLVSREYPALMQRIMKDIVIKTGESAKKG